MQEIWENIKNYEGLYQISNFGRVKKVSNNNIYLYKYKERNALNKKRIIKEKILKNGVDKGGYFFVVLCKNSNTKVWKIHRLVAMHFVNNFKNKPAVNHIDGNKNNNYYFYLEWVTSSENQKHACKIGLANFSIGEKNFNSKLKEKDVLFIRNNANRKNKKEIAEKLNISIDLIYKILNYKNWKYL